MNLLGKLTGGGEDERLTFTEFRIQLGKGTNGKGGRFPLDSETKNGKKKSEFRFSIVGEGSHVQVASNHWKTTEKVGSDFKFVESSQHVEGDSFQTRKMV